MKVGDVVHGRFEVTDRRPKRPTRGVDRETGAHVVFVEDSGFGWFLSLDVVAAREMARRVIELGDPRFATVLSTDPVVIEAPPDEQIALTPREWVDAAIELAEVTSLALASGVLIQPRSAWVERGRGGAVRLRAPAPVGAVGLHFWQLPRRWMGQTSFTDVTGWLSSRLENASVVATPDPLRRCLRELGKTWPLLDGGELVRRLAPFSANAARAEQRASSVLPIRDRFHARVVLDFDRAIALGEEELTRCTKPIAGRERGRGYLEYLTRPLAAAYHHRGCVASSQGERGRAMADVSRAIELDPHARYLTTRALWEEARGDRTAALADHSRAVGVLQGPPPEADPGGTGIVVIEGYPDPPERAAADAARTLHARGAFLAREGRLEEALADLEASVLRRATAAALAALSSVRRRLGDRAGAIEAAERALALEPDHAAARRMRQRAGERSGRSG